MASPRNWFVEQRAEDLAIVLLTRFPVSVTREVNGGRGLNLRVTVDPPGVHEFGVEIKGSMQIRNLVDQHHRVLPQAIRGFRSMLKDCPFPVAIMVFDVKTDNGFFGWLLAPVISESQAGLTEVDPVSVEPATDDAISRALSQIREWYRARPWRVR